MDGCRISRLAAESRPCRFPTFRLTFAAGGTELDAHAPAGAAPLLLRDPFGTGEATAAC